MLNIVLKVYTMYDNYHRWENEIFTEVFSRFLIPLYM